MSTTTTRERPILFSAPMVRALLDGTKTQTRRIAKPPAKAVFLPDDYWRNDPDEPGTAYLDDGSGRLLIRCPYGVPGDRLWVRETFSLVPCSAGCEKYPDGFDPKIAPCRQPDAPSEGVRYRATWDRSHSLRWSPSIHMPRWASRITLEITGVRVERLHAISEADAWAEGFPDPEGRNREYPDRARYWFRHLWAEINGKPSWDADPWVWVVEFRRVGP